MRKNSCGFRVALILAVVFAVSLRDSVYSQGTIKSEPLDELKVMSFNIWVGGGKSETETLRVIRSSRADIVGIQESNKSGKNVAKAFAEEMKWSVHAPGGSCTIISRFPILETSENGFGAKIQISEKQFAWMFNLHLIHCPYEPYQLNGIEYCGAPFLETAEQAVESAWKSRKKDVEGVLADIERAKKDKCPIFLSGDFNEPSCLDWTERASKAKICKMPVKWPATAALQEKGGLKDSYRTKYPDELAHKGHTWTTLPGEREVLDRIDFLFFHGDNVEVKNVQIVGEKSDLSDIGFENYPSDHRAVLGTFSLDKP